MKKRYIAGIAVAAVVALAAAAVPLIENHAAGRIKAEIERDGSTGVESVEVGLLARSVAILDLRSRQSDEVAIRRWEATGLAWPLAELMRGRTPLTGWKLGDPLNAERVEVEGLRIVNPGGPAWSFDRLLLEGFELARYDANVGGGPNRFTFLGARVLAALSLRRLEERNVVATNPLTGDTLGIASITLEKLSQGRIGTFELKGVGATGPGGREKAFEIAELKGSGLDFSRLLAALSDVSWRPGAPLGRLGLDSARATGFAGELMTRYGIALDSVTLETVREGRDVSRTRTRVAGFVLAPPLRGLESLQLRLMLQTMGLKELRLDFECAGTEDRAKGEVNVERCALAGPELGTADLTFKLVQLDRLFWQAMDEGNSALLYDSKAAIGGARLVLADKSLLERALRALASTTGQPVAVTRANLATEIRRYQPAGVLITENLTKLLDTAARFVEQGGTLIVEAKPDPPFGIDKASYLSSPGPDLVELLGLSATLSR